MPKIPPDSSGAVENCLQMTQQLLACGRMLRQQLAVVTRQIGLNDTQFLVLWSCSTVQSSRTSQRDLGERLGISPAQISAMVEDLRRRNLLIGQRSASDRRRQTWCLTSEGQAVVDAAATALQPWADTMANHLGDRDLIAMVQALATAMDIVDGTRDEPVVLNRQNDSTPHIARGAA